MKRNLVNETEETLALALTRNTCLAERIHPKLLHGIPILD